MGVYVGAGAAIAEYALETGAYGNADVFDVALDLVDESMKENTEPLRSGVFMGSRAHKTYHQGFKGASGDFKFIANPDNLPKIIYAALGIEDNESQVLGLTAEVTEITCEADTGGSLSGEYITFDAPAGPFYAWFDVDDLGSIDPALAGKTGIPVGITEDDVAATVATALAAAINANANFGAGAVAAVVTITNADDGAVDDATNGDTGWGTAPDITTQGSGGTAYDHDFTPVAAGGDLPTLHVGIDKHGSEYAYPGVTINTLMFEFTKGDYLYVTAGTLAQKELDDVATLQGLALSTKLPYVGDYVSLEVGGAAVDYGISGSVTINNFLDEEGSKRMIGTRYRAEPRSQTFMVTANLEIEWLAASDALRDAIRDNTDTHVAFVITHETAIEAGYYYTITIDIPTAKIIGDLPQLNTRDRIPFTLNVEGVYNATNLIKVTHRDALAAKWSA